MTNPFANTEPLRRSVNSKGCYKIKILGLGILRHTDAQGYRVIKKYKNKKDAQRRLDLERSRGWKGKVVRC